MHCIAEIVFHFQDMYRGGRPHPLQFTTMDLSSPGPLFYTSGETAGTAGEKAGTEGEKAGKEGEN